MTAIVAAGQRAGRREWIGLAVIALPCMLYSMDLTVLNLAVPALSEDLKPSSSQLLWIIDVYGFMVAGALIIMGTLGDRIGRRRLLMIGAAAFGAGSVLAAFSRSAEMLIATRALLGLAGATLAPSTLSLIRNMFHDPSQRTTAIGIWVTSYSAGAAIGPLLGGLMLQRWWWGSVFLLGVPVMILLLVVGPVLLPEYRDPKAGRMDILSAAMSLVSVLLCIYGLKQIAQDGWSYPSFAAIVAGVLVGAAFLRRQQKLASPLIDPALFRVRAFNVALVTYLLGTFVGFGAYIFLAQYLQLVRGLSPLEAGLWMIPWSLAYIVGSNLTPVIARRVPPPVVMSAGLMIAAAGFALIALADRSSGFGLIMVSVVIYSIGLSPVVTLATDIIVGSAPAERAGSASAISETSSELGGALGIAILGSIGTAVYRSDIADAISHGLPREVAAAARGTLGGAVSVAQHLPDQVGVALVAAGRESFFHAMQLTSGVCAVIVLASALMVHLVLRRVG